MKSIIKLGAGVTALAMMASSAFAQQTLTAETVEITISDNGIGIPEKQLDRVFLVLHRAVDSEKYPGAGIGLAIAKKVVRLHGGKISLESTDGVGTTVSFSIVDKLSS